MRDSADIAEGNSTLRRAVGVILHVFLISLHSYMQWT